MSFITVNLLELTKRPSSLARICMWGNAKAGLDANKYDHNVRGQGALDPACFILEP